MLRRVFSDRLRLSVLLTQRLLLQVLHILVGRVVDLIVVELGFGEGRLPHVLPDRLQIDHLLRLSRVVVELHSLFARQQVLLLFLSLAHLMSMFSFELLEVSLL